MKQVLVGAMCAILLAVSPASAQKADPERISTARELLKQMGSDKQFGVAIETMTKGLTEVMVQKNPGKATEIREVMKLMLEKFKSRKDEVQDMVAPLWAEQFTVAEMKEIGGFFASPIGKKLIETQPIIMQKSMQLGMAWGQKIGQEVEAEARSELKKRGIDL